MPTRKIHKDEMKQARKDRRALLVKLPVKPSIRQAQERLANAGLKVSLATVFEDLKAVAELAEWDRE